MALTDKLTALGDAIREKNGTTDPMTLDQMTSAVQRLEIGSTPNVEEITIIENGTYTPNEGVDGFSRVVVNVPVDLGDLPEDLLHLTGNQDYKFYGNSWNSFLNKYGNQITTENITSISHMFGNNSQLQNIPFALNMNKSTDCRLNDAFLNASKLEHLPVISDCKVDQNGLGGICDNCINLKEINIDFTNWDLSSFANVTYLSDGGLHVNCHSLRQIPMSYYNKLSQTKTVGKDYNNSIYFYFCYNCNNIDEIIDMPVMILDKYTSNAFGNSLTSTYRLKDFIFKVQEDGTPYSASGWKSSVIDLSTSGFALLQYSFYARDFYLHNSGITIDKCIYNDETYQALKDDPDSYVAGYSSENPHYYSRYDKASAIRTINSLPDVSGSGGVNTIRFKGEAGLKTDGGAINTMTEEEIAVATSKGWTVSFI